MKQWLLNRIPLLVACVLLLTCLTACGACITWMDADGVVLETYIPEEGQKIPDRPLPPDDDEWHYTGWKVQTRGKSASYTAERVAKIPVTWMDADGTVLHTETVNPGEKPAVYPLPLDNEDWIYSGWQEEERDGGLVYTAGRIAKTKVYWRDTDGTLIHSESFAPSARIPERQVPPANSSYVYTGWTKSQEQNIITFTATRVTAKTIVWCEADGTVIETEYLPFDQDVTMRALPQSKKWDYTNWEKTVTGTTYTYRAIGTPKTSYLAGNVFQLVGKDLTENVITLGTGFVVNNQGWFITNYHVLENAAAACGIFQIRNTNGESYTTLTISKIAYFDKDKDILIGKLDNYNTISPYYQNIPLQIRYNVGDVTYTAGYPNGTEKMEIHEGEVLRNLAGLADKLYAGVDYIASSSYAAPGSSGGILLNEKLEVIGLVSRALGEGEDFELCAAIEAYNFQGLITSKTKSSMLTPIAKALQPKLGGLADVLADYKSRGLLELKEEDGVFYYEVVSVWESTDASSDKYVKTRTYLFYGNGYVFMDDIVEWESGDKRELCFYGNYADGIDSFCYIFAYEFSPGRGYAVVSEDINYSTDVTRTLSRYSSEGYGGYYVSQDNLTYAKKRFNEMYELALNDIFC